MKLRLLDAKHTLVLEKDFPGCIPLLPTDHGTVVLVKGVRVGWGKPIIDLDEDTVTYTLSTPPHATVLRPSRKATA